MQEEEMNGEPYINDTVTWVFGFTLDQFLVFWASFWEQVSRNFTFGW